MNCSTKSHRRNFGSVSKPEETPVTPGLIVDESFELLLGSYLANRSAPYAALNFARTAFAKFPEELKEYRAAVEAARSAQANLDSIVRSATASLAMSDQVINARANAGERSDTYYRYLSQVPAPLRRQAIAAQHLMSNMALDAGSPSDALWAVIQGWKITGTFT